jgi:serine protease Do
MNRVRAFVAPVILISLAVAVSCDTGGEADPTPAVDNGENREGIPVLKEEGLTTAEIAARLAPAIVRVQTEGATLDVFGRVVPGGGVGTGVIIDDEGHIVTNNHVITVGDEPAARITVTLSSGRAVPAEIVGRDEPTDLAVLGVDVDDLTPASFAAPGSLRIGQDVVAIGFALGLEGAPTVTRGVLSAKGRTIEEEQYTIPDALQTDAGINPGNSGGPLVNADGQIVGINTAIIRGAQSIGFAISVAVVEPIVQELIQSGRVERAFLGVGTVDVTEGIADSFNLPVDDGVAITAVGDRTPAADAGLRENDVIVRVGGQPVRNSGDLLAALAQHRAGDIVEVEYYRANDLRTADVTLTDRPG